MRSVLVMLTNNQKRRSYAAVKAVSQTKLTRKLKENLESEIRILKSLQHPHIVALFTCTETPAYIYLVMEYCQLSDLAQFMKKREQLPSLSETADIFKKYPNSPFGLNEVIVRHFVKQIASALEYLRVRNLVHRDIKPQNLLLNPSPMYMARQKPEDMPLAASEHSLVPAVGVESLPMLKIADFGFARHLPQQTMAETLCGSPLYMAPEILSYQKYDAKADLWGVGAVTYEMMAGKPPFRAANHVDLLRKIQNAQDVIPFPSGLIITSDLKRMIRYLLKQKPTERISFDSWFKCPPVVGSIPGLIGEDIPRTSNVPMPDPGISEISRRMQKQAIDAPTQSRPENAEMARRPSSSVIKQAEVPQPETELSRRPDVPRSGSSGGGTRPLDIKRPQSGHAVRPAMMAHATAPAREFMTRERLASRDASGLQRQMSKHFPTPGSSAPKPSTITERRHDVNDEERERTAQDLAFEKEYVLVEKRAVVVNAFADELAASPHVHKHGAMVRRTTTQGLPTSTTGAQPASPSNALQAATGRRLDVLHNRQTSFERRYAPNPSSATNMLSKALNAANARLYGFLGGSPPVGAGPSPPRGYTAFPSYPSPPLGLAITDGKDHNGAIDEDARMLRTVEEAATRSDTVYSFAEVKYRQLLPATPASEDGPGIRQIGAVEKPMHGSAEEDQDLTQVAVVAVSEEALVLFVKALAILAKCIDLAGYWWSSQRRSEGVSATPPSPRSNTNTAEVSKRMNNVVQWARTRFNECLEKSEIVGRRLIEAQRKLPSDHPGHPDNHTGSSAASGSATSIGTSAEHIQLTSGVTAERLMYERAVEMSRQAAVNELIEEDLKGCEISYRTALILFEAVLEGDDEPLESRPRTNKDKCDEEEAIAGMDGEDRRTVLKCGSDIAIVSTYLLTFATVVEGTRARLKALVRKIQAQQTMERRVSATGVPTKSRPSPNTAMLGTPPK